MIFRKKIVDRQGELPVSQMRELFERVIRDTAQLRDTLDTTADLTGGAFNGYKDETTNALWCGFAIGCRCSDRIARNGGGR